MIINKKISWGEKNLTIKKNNLYSLLHSLTELMI